MALPIGIDMHGRVVVITGAARGMGAAYTRGFLAEGAQVVATDRSWAGAEAFQAELDGAGVLCLDMDVTDDGQRSEERRVGKEWRCRWSAYRLKTYVNMCVCVA